MPTRRVSTPWRGQRRPRAPRPRASTSASVDLLGVGARRGGWPAAASTAPSARRGRGRSRAARSAAGDERRRAPVAAGRRRRRACGCAADRRRLLGSRRRRAPVRPATVDPVRVADGALGAASASTCRATAGGAWRHAGPAPPVDPAGAIDVAMRAQRRPGGDEQRRPRRTATSTTTAPAGAEQAARAARRPRRRASRRRPAPSTWVPGIVVRARGHVEQAEEGRRRPGRRRAPGGAGARCGRRG